MNTSSTAARYARMLRIFRHLQSGSGLNADDLASQLDVCRRTIFRDLSLMRDAGIAVEYDGRLDCYRLAPCRDLVGLPALEHEELTTLVAAVHLSVLRCLPDYGESLRQATTKLLAHSPYQVQHHAVRLMNSCSIRPAADKHPAAIGRVMQQMLQSISQRRTLRLRVWDTVVGQEITTRFAPYQVIATIEAWQVIGRSSHHRRVQTLDPRHVRTTEMTDEIYAIPRGFQPQV